MKGSFPYPTLAPPVTRVPSSNEDAFDDPRCNLDFIIYQGGERWASDWLRIQSFSGQDSISDFFQYQVELRANDQYVPPRPKTPPVEVRPLDFGKILGSDAMVRIGLPVKRDADGRPLEPVDYVPFCGIVTELRCAGPGTYSLTLRPRLWTLTLRNGYRIFKGLNVTGVVDTLLREHGIKDYDLSALDDVADGRQQDWLQAGETDFELLQRLLGKIGGYFYFEHSLPPGPRTPGIHKLVFGNRPAYKEIPGRRGGTRTLYYTFSKNEPGLELEDLLAELGYQQTLMPSGISTTIAEVGSAWLQEPLAEVKKSLDPSYAEPPICVRYSVYEYGTCQAETDALSAIEEQARLGSTFTLSGRSSATTLKSGHWFKLSQKVPPVEGGERPDVLDYRPELDGKSFVLMSVSHQATVDGDYTNSFSARDRAASVLNFSIAATHQGSVLAQVVAHGGQGSAPHPRHYLDRGDFALGTKTFKNTAPGGGELPCKGVYVQLVVGGDGPVFVKVPGSSSSIPEVGTWVVVGRSNDDSELPEIQQIVQSKGSQTIVPDEDLVWATENTTVGSSYGTSYGDSHSIRYGRLSPVDLEPAAQELKAAYATGQYKDVSYSVGGSYSVSKADAGEAGMLSYSVAVGSTYSESTATTTESHSKVTGVSTSVSDVGVSQSTSITGESISTSLTKGNSTSTQTINGTSTSTTTIPGISNNVSMLGVSNNISLTGASSSISTTGAAVSISSTGASSSVSTTGIAASVSVVGASTDVSMRGAAMSASVTGATVSASVTGTTMSDSTTGVSANVATTGVSSNVATTGASANVSMTGVSSNLSVTGVHDSVSSTGMSTNVDMTGISTNMKITGVATTLEQTGVGIDLGVHTAVKITVKSLQVGIPTLEITV